MSSRTVEPQPRGISTEMHPNALHITLRLFRWSSLLWLVATLASDCVILWALGTGVFGDGPGLPQGLLVVAVVLLLPIVVLANYFVLAAMINRCRIHVTRGSLAVKYSPVPVGENRTIVVFDVAQLFVRAQPRRYGRRNTRYEVRVVLRNGARRLLVRSLRTRDEAAYIERTIERFLGIVDEPVEGEL